MPERRYCAALDQVNRAVAFDPIRVALEWKLGAPTELTRRRREPFLTAFAYPELGADATDKDDLSSGLKQAGKLVKCRLGIRHCGHHVLGHHYVERGVRKFKLLSIHHEEALNVTQAELPYPLCGLFQHRGRNIDAAEPRCSLVIRQGNTCADTDLKDATTDPFGRCDRGGASALANRAKYEIVDRRPARISLGDGVPVEIEMVHACPSFAAPPRRQTSVVQD